MSRTSPATVGTSRRIGATAAAIAAIAVAATGCSGSNDAGADDAPTPLTLQTSWIPLVQFAGSYIADHEGYYEDNGVDVGIVAGGPEVDAMAAVEAGQADIGLSNADTVARANAEGADLVIVAAGFQKNPLSILSTAENPIETPEDMIGKKIGVPSGDEAAQDALLAYNDIDASQVESVPVSFDVAPLVSGEVDGLWVFYAEQPVSYQESTGEEGTVMLTADYGFDLYAQVYVVARSTLEDETKRAAVVGFLTGEIQGWQDYVADQDEAVDLTVNDYAKDSGLSVENQTEQAERQLDLLVTPETEENGLLWMSDDGIQKNLDTLDALAIDGVDESLFDTSLLTEIYADGNTVE